MQFNDELKSKFMARIALTGDCWLWTGPATPKGYGRFSYYENGRDHIVAAHRFAWWAWNNEIVPATLMVCHKCDNPRCVRPDHLFVGTAKDNTRDMMRKGRAVYKPGDLNGRAKLKPEQVLEIRQALDGLSSRGTLASLARRYGVAPTTIRDIRNGRNWASLR